MLWHEAADGGGLLSRRVMEAKRTFRRHRKTGAIDPKQTGGVAPEVGIAALGAAMRLERPGDRGG
jgi:hypothetical protein